MFLNIFMYLVYLKEDNLNRILKALIALSISLFATSGLANSQSKSSSKRFYTY